MIAIFVVVEIVIFGSEILANAILVFIFNWVTLFF